MYEAQEKAIRNQTVEFVVLRSSGKQREYGADVPYLLDNYELVDTAAQEFEHRNFVYCLFRAKG